MKRICILLIITALFAGNIMAQEARQPREQRNRQQPVKPQTVSVTGTLQLQNGSIVLVSGEDVYRVPALVRLAGFLDGVKEGKQVSVEGLGMGKSIHLSKLTVDGKSYDFPQQRQSDFGQDRFAPQQRGGHHDRFQAPMHNRKFNRNGSCHKW
jgi:hypothetical protein